MKTTIAILAAALTVGAAADEALTNGVEIEETDELIGLKVKFGGFGHGNIRTKAGQGGSDREEVWGPEMEVHYNVYEGESFRLWVGVGGAFAPRQDVYGRRSRSSTSEHQVSDDGYVIYDFEAQTEAARSLELQSTELRLIATPEWQVSDSFSIGGRMGVALEWLQGKYRNSSSWHWNSSFITDIPGIGQEVDLDSDSETSNSSGTKSEFAAYGIIGLEATYMFNDMVGLYAFCDWRIGDDVKFRTSDGSYKVDMNGWYAGAGVVVQF